MPSDGNMKEFLQLIRWQNLGIVVLTMVLMRYAIIAPLISRVGITLLQKQGEAIPMTLQFPLISFIILVMATVCITAAGYVINDYFDIRTDLINRGRVIVGTKIPRRQAIMWHTVLNLAGVSAGFYISWKAGYLWFGTLFLVVSGLLYFYSASYKRQFLIGNIIVAILTAMVPLLVVVFEWSALYRYYAANAVTVPDLSFLFYWVGGFAMFAIMTTLAREIIKDVEDFEGDKAYGRNSLPVIIGIPGSKIVAACLVIITIISLFSVWYLFLHDWLTLAYISVTIAIPLFYVIYLIVIASERKQMNRASQLMKIVMLAGVLYSVVVKIILTWNLV